MTPESGKKMSFKINESEYRKTIESAVADGRLNSGAVPAAPLVPIFLFTGNRDKIEEFNHYFAKTRFRFIGTAALSDGLRKRAKDDEPEETGKTLLENSIIKSSFGYLISGVATVADDTGFFVDALNGDPGVKAGRYAGPVCDYEANRVLLLKNLESVPESARTACFRCMITLYWPGAPEPFEFLGESRGTVIRQKRPGNQFGYDPVFVPEGHKEAFSEMDLELKNSISHRGRAFAKLEKFLVSAIAN